MRRFSSSCHIPPSGRSLPGDIAGAETKVLVPLEDPEPGIPGPPGSGLRGTGRKVQVLKPTGALSQTPLQTFTANPISRPTLWGSEGNFTFDPSSCPALPSGPLPYLAMGCMPWC